MSNETPTDALRLVPVNDDAPTNRKLAVALSNHPEIMVVERSDPSLELTERSLEEVLDELAAAPASPLPEGGGWQDISTAPKDGTKILVLTHHGEVEISEWYETKGDTYVPEPGTDLFRLVKGKVFFEGWNSNTPTHWMPLPAAPTGDA